MTTAATTSTMTTNQTKLLLVECKAFMQDIFARGEFKTIGPTRSRMDNLIKHIDRIVYDA